MATKKRSTRNTNKDFKEEAPKLNGTEKTTYEGIPHEEKKDDDEDVVNHDVVKGEDVEDVEMAEDVEEEKEDKEEVKPKPSNGKNLKGRKSMDGKESEIRFGALEVMAAYTGGEEEGGEKGSLPYSFVVLTTDITYGDDDTDLTTVQWLEPSLKGKLFVEGESDIAVGSFICPVTTEVVEFGNGTYDVPEAVHQMIKSKLEKQLADDYDPDQDDEEEMDYETRMSKKRKTTTTKRGRKKKRAVDDSDDFDPKETKVKKEGGTSKKKGGRKKKMNHDDDDDPDVEMEDLDFKEKEEDKDDDDEEVKQPTKKRQKTTRSNATTTSKKAATTNKKKKKTHLEPRDDLEIMENPWLAKTGKFNSFNGDTHRASKEIVRAYLSKDTAVLSKLLKDTKNIADIFAFQSCDVPKNIYDYAILNEDKETVAILVNEMKKPTPNRVEFPTCSILEFSSGKHTSRYAARNRYNVGASRGGKEGNNAFTSDMDGSFYSKGHSEPLVDIVELLRNHDSVSLDFFDHFDKDVHNGKLISWGFNFHNLVCFGHQELAMKTMKVLLHRDVGLNNLHVDCLGSGHTLDKFRSVSVEKKSSADAGVRFCPVHCAASNSNPTYLKQLLEVKPDAIGCLDSEEAGLLHYAAVGKSSETLKYILDGPGASLNRNLKLRKGDKTTPLMWAARTCRADNIRVLCDDGKHEKTSEMFKTLDVNGLSALHHIAQSNRKDRLEAAQALIDCGADVNIKGDARLQNKQTPFMISAAKGDLELLKILHAAGADVLLNDKLDKTPLMLSVKNGNIHVASFLLKLGVDVNAEDSSGNTALHYACAYGWSDCVKLLIELGGDINATNSWMTTPLELALKKGRFACAIILLKEKVNVNVIDRNGVSLFNSLVSSYVTQLSQNKTAPLPWTIKKILERDDLDISTTDKEGQTLLHYISKVTGNGDNLLDLVKTLLSKGADPLILNKGGEPPAVVALKHKNLKLCCHLLEHSSHVEAIKTCKDNLLGVLMLSIVQVDYEFFMKLFSYIKEINPLWVSSVDERGMTPLMVAAKTVRTNWSSSGGKGKEILEHLFNNFPDQLKEENARVAKYREWNDDLFENGLPCWKANDEFEPGSRTILHEILQCPDLDWVLRTCEKHTKLFNSTSLTLKTNEGNDVITFALDTFVDKKVDVKCLIELIKLLKNGGASMNAVNHPLFQSLKEVEENSDTALDFSFAEKDIDSALAFVRNREQLNIKKFLKNEKQRKHIDTTLFEPRLQTLMKRSDHNRPTPELVSKLIKECEFDPDIQDIFGNTLLHKINELKYVQCLVQLCNLNAINKDGETPLTRAINDIALVRTLIQNGADVDVLTPVGTALHLAVSNGNNEVVELLLKTCDVNVKDQNGVTPLHLAVSHGAISTRETLHPIETQLLQAGADINALDDHGRSPIFYCFFPLQTDTDCQFPPASKRDPIDMLTTMANRVGVNLEVEDKDKRTPLHYAAAVGASICLLLLCERSGTMLNRKDADDNTPLGLSILAGRSDTSILLISKGGDVDISVTKTTRVRKDGKLVITSKETMSALKKALKIESCESVARYMLAAEKLSILTILNALFSTGNFQLAMNQIKMGHSNEMMKLQNRKDGMTALHYLSSVKTTSSQFALPLANELLGLGVPAASKCNRGRTALHLASMNGHFELCQLLISRCNLPVDDKDINDDTPISLMFNNGTPSQKILFLLATSSRDKSACVNVSVKGQGKRTDDRKWEELCNFEHTLFAVPECKRRGQEEYIRYLERQKAKTEIESDEMYEIKSTTLIESVKLRDQAIVNTLLHFGAEGSRKDQNGRTALHHAVISNDAAMVSLLLMWNRFPLDCVDAFGLSALSYSILNSIKSSSSNKIFSHLMAFGANPCVGNALNIAIKANLEEIVIAMLFGARNQSTKSDSKIQPSSLKVGDLIWARYGKFSSVWSCAKVSGVNGSKYSVIPSSKLKHRNCDVPSLTVEMKSALEICDVSPDSICLYDENTDIAIEAKDVILSYLDKNIPNCENNDLFKLYGGAEVNLLETIAGDGLKVGSLTSKFKKGDTVGYLENGYLFVGEVMNIYPNMQLEIKLLNGQTLKAVNRANLRQLSDELKLKSKMVRGALDSQLIHDLIEPIESLSFENATIFEAMIDAGIPLEGKNKHGESPLQKSRVGSAIQKRISELISMSPPEDTLMEITPERTTDVDFEAHADAEYQALLSLESANTEQVVPQIIPVIKKELDQDSSENFVLAERDVFFDVSLTKVDVTQGQWGKYEFYRMQIAHLPMKNTYVLLTNWGRIGEYGGGKFQQTPYINKEACIKEFEKVFKSKTGNLWENRDQFVKQPKKYRLVKRPTRRLKNPDKLLGEALVEKLPCSLPLPVSNLLRFFLDVERLVTAYGSSNIDHKTLPFGQLTISTIQRAESKLEDIKRSLKQLSELRAKGSNDINDFRAAINAIAMETNEFYELLPMGNDCIVTPFQENDHRFQEAGRLIYQLRDLTVAKQLLMGARHRQNVTNPIEYVYNAVQVQIKPLDANCMERKCLMQYVDNTCTQDDVIVHQIYSLNDGKAPCDIPNKKLLFHGSGNENVLGILKHGLLIAPPAASRCGNAYGDGVYFADQFDKAFGYCTQFDDSSGNNQPRCFIFVAEVALGESYVPNLYEHIERAPDGHNSTHAQGGKEPEKSFDMVMQNNGGTIPLGEVKQITKQKSFQWSKKPDQNISWRRDLSPESTKKVEKARIDPNSKFPLKISIDEYGVEEQVTVYGPDSEIATVVAAGVKEVDISVVHEKILSIPTKGQNTLRSLLATKAARRSAPATGGNNYDSDEDSEEEEEDDEDMEGEEDESEIRISSFGNSNHLLGESTQSNVTIISREEQNQYHRNPNPSEFIVYDTKQIRLKYLIEVTSKKWVREQYDLREEENLNENDSSLLRLFDFYPMMDSYGNDIELVSGCDDVEKLAKICLNDSNCKGFNSYGWMKHTIKPKSEWIHLGGNPKLGLYVKKNM